jgi:hypothetical protein
LIEHGWSLKHIHRQILTSAAYRQDGRIDEARKRVDPDNRLWWHRTPFRLEAEIIRDAMLAVSGRLDRTQFGPGTLDEAMRRRSIYFFAKRSQLPPGLVQFDAPDTLQSVGARVNTTVAPQALLLLNNTHVRACAHGLAQQLRPAIAQSRSAGIALAFRLTLGREPLPAERENAERFVDARQRTATAKEADQAPWVDLCHVLFLLNEFVYVE